jgi:hydrogenase maturation protease
VKKTLIIGVGNTLMSDEGVGVAVAKALMNENLPAGVQVVDAGCALLNVLMDLEGFDRVVIIDAAAGGGRPGNIYRFDSSVLADKTAAPRCLTSLHEIGVPESIAMAEISGSEIPPVTIIGVEPSSLELGTELSGPIKSKIPDIVQAVKNELVETAGE